MSKYYITFGQAHKHNHNNLFLNKDIIGVINANSEQEARALAFKWFGDKFATTYHQQDIDTFFVGLFPRGFVELN